MKKRRPAKMHIQEVAAMLFSKKGYDSVSIMDICNESGVNNSMVSYYFGGKMGLYKSITDNILNSQQLYIDKLIKLEDFKQLSLERQKEEFIKVIDKFVDFFYSEISTDVVVMLLREQQNPLNDDNFEDRIPCVLFIRDLLAEMLCKTIKSYEVAFHVMSLISLMTWPRVHLKLRSALLTRNELTAKDIDRIRKILKDYIDKLIEIPSSK